MAASDLDQIVNLSKRRGFVFPSAEIYGGFRSTYDFGPLGSLLLRNETPGGNWLDVLVEGRNGVNRMGIGSKVKVYAAGKLGEASALLGCREIAAGYGYCSGQEAAAHFGLGKEETVDVEVILPHGKGASSHKSVKANQRLVVKP